MFSGQPSTLVEMFFFGEGCGNVYAQPLPVPVVDPTAGNRKREGAEKWLKVAVVSLCAIAVILIVS